MKQRKVILAGGSGQLGQILRRSFISKGWDVVVLSRGGHTLPGQVVQWDGKESGAWVEELEGADVVVNLAGRSVNCRLTKETRREILASRVGSTRALGLAIEQCPKPPALWLQASTATIYAHRLDAPNDEKTGILGGSEPGVPKDWGFSIQVAKAWEAAADGRVLRNTRLVKMRSAMVMSPDAGGIFDVLMGMVLKGLGGTVGDGGQYVSWIHEWDFVEAVHWLIEHREVAGVVNLASPNPLPNAEFMEVLREVSGGTFGFRSPRWLVELGARLMRTESEILLKSRRVVPGRLLEGGFRFKLPKWPEAAAELHASWKGERP